MLTIIVTTPNEFSVTMPTSHLPCPLYLFLALFLLVAEYFVCDPRPCLVFLGVASIVGVTPHPPFAFAINYKLLPIIMLACWKGPVNTLGVPPITKVV